MVPRAAGRAGGDPITPVAEAADRAQQRLGPTKRRGEVTLLDIVTPHSRAVRILLAPAERPARHRRIRALSSRPGPVDAPGVAPAEPHAGGSITTRGPIPRGLFAGCTLGPS